jgi:hypothetical protein
MNWIFEAYSNVYHAAARLRAGAPSDLSVTRPARARRARWQGFIADRR